MQTTDTKCAFLWDDPDQDQWREITRIMVDRINLWIHSGQGFISSFDLPWSKWSQIADPDPDHPKGMHPKSQPQRVNSYKLFIADTAVIRWICIGWILSILAGELCRVKAQSLHTKERFAKGIQRNITDFLKASMTTDSMKIFFYYILYSNYCLLHSGFVQVIENLESHGI